MRANRIITDLLNFAGLGKINKVRSNIHKVIDKSLLLIGYEIGKKAIDVSRKYKKDIPELLIDENRIEQVLVNIFLNAIHAMNKGGNLGIKTYFINMSKDVEEIPNIIKNRCRIGQKVVFIEVNDSGCGIPENKLDKIFDPFYTSRRSVGGVGLGLSISQSIIESHEGLIVIQNKKNEGVTVKIIFKV